MARPKQAPQRSMNRLTTRTERVTAVNYNETERIRKHDSREWHDARTGADTDSDARHDFNIATGASLRVGGLQAGQRARPTAPAWNEFRMQVVTAVGEAFNNIVLHGYEGHGRRHRSRWRSRPGPDHISIELRDCGASFDPGRGAAARFRQPARVRAGHLHHQDLHGYQLHARPAQRAYTVQEPALELGDEAAR